MRVLCADDEEDVRMLLELSLGFDPEIDAEIVPSGAAVLERAAAVPPWDAIVLDGLMPGLDGVETCRRLKSSPETAGIPVVFLTGLATAAERAPLMAAGALGCIPKPFDPMTLAATLRALLQTR